MARTNDQNRRLADAVARIKPLLARPELASEISIVSPMPSGPPPRTRIPTIRVTSYRALVRVAGLFRYHAGSGLLFRGQVESYGNLRPSAYRRGDLARADTEIDRFVEAIRTVGLVDVTSSDRARETTEPLLQHYGFATRWVDVVDSLPHALFFATHQRVKSVVDGDLFTYIPSIAECGYIYLVDTGDWTVRLTASGSPLPGVWNTSRGLRVCDLRAAKPSTALRPHAQHGLLFRSEEPLADYWTHVVAQISVETRAARGWITGAALAREELFPTPRWDQVYAALAGMKARDWYAGYRWQDVELGSVDLYDFCGFTSGRIGPQPKAT